MLAIGGLLGLGLVFGTGASSSESTDTTKSPVRLEGFVNSSYVTGYKTEQYEWRVTAVDNVIVKDLIINRGQKECKTTYAYPLDNFRERELKFGEMLKFASSKVFCNPLEVKVVTNKGDWVFDMTK